MYYQPRLMAPFEQPEKVYLDDNNSDLHLNIERDGLTANDMHERGFEFIWAGVRATHGIDRGKVCFEVHVLENLRVKMPDSESTPNVCRVGWSIDSQDMSLGESHLSYGYGGTGKVSTDSKFFNYGEPYTAGDVITCYVDLEATPNVVFFTKNGQYLGIAFRLGREIDGKTLYPHVYVKNIRFHVNFGNERPIFPPVQGFCLLEHVSSSALIRGPRGPTHRQECDMLMMVGVPGAGKTVWAEKYAKDHPEKKYNILGTNTIMDKMKVMGLTRKRNYHGRWDQLIKQASDILNQTFKIAERKNRNYILDQTNVYPNARRRKMNNFRGYHRVAAVVVTTNEVLKERTLKRQQEEGKIVPEEAVMEMKANFTLPEKGESFDDVWFVEEDAERSKVLVQEFQQEGKRFQEAAKKRPIQETGDQTQSNNKKPCFDRNDKDTKHVPNPSSLPHVPSSIPYVPSSVPHVPSSVPHVPSSIPHVPSSVPHVQGSIPDVKHRIPDLKPHIPDLKPPISSGIPHIPDNMPHIPDTKPVSMQHIPDIKPIVPISTPDRYCSTPSSRREQPHQLPSFYSQGSSYNAPKVEFMRFKKEPGSPTYTQSVPEFDRYRDSPSQYPSSRYDECRPGALPSSHPPPPGPLPYSDKLYGGGYGSAPTTNTAPQERYMQETERYDLSSGYSSIYGTSDPYASAYSRGTYPSSYPPPSNYPPPSSYPPTSSYPVSTFDSNYGGDLSQSSNYTGYASQDSAFSSDNYTGYGSQANQYPPQGMSFEKPYQGYHDMPQRYPPQPGSQGEYSQGRYNYQGR